MGSRPGSSRCDRDAVKIVVQTPEKAETIALAFIEMAHKMREVLEDEEEEDIDDDYGDYPCTGECYKCPRECDDTEV